MGPHAGTASDLTWAEKPDLTGSLAVGNIIRLPRERVEKRNGVWPRVVASGQSGAPSELPQRKKRTRGSARQAMALVASAAAQKAKLNSSRHQHVDQALVCPLRVRKGKRFGLGPLDRESEAEAKSETQH